MLRRRRDAAAKGDAVIPAKTVLLQNNLAHRQNRLRKKGKKAVPVAADKTKPPSLGWLLCFIVLNFCEWLVNRAIHVPVILFGIGSVVRV